MTSNLILDLGSDSVALAEYTPELPIRFSFYKRLSIAREHRPQAVELWQVTEHALEQLGHAYREHIRHHGGKARTVHIVASAPWVTDHVTEHELVEHKNIAWTEELIKKSILSKLGDQSSLDWYITNIQSRGYTVTELPCTSDQLTVTTMHTDIHTDIKKAVTGIVQTYTHASVLWHSLSKISFEAGLATIPHQNWIMFDIHGEHTEILAVEKQNIKWLASIPQGTHTLLRVLRKQTGFPVSVIESMLHMSEEKSLESGAEKKLQDALASCLTQWKESVANILKDKSLGGITYLALNTPYDTMYVKPLETIFKQYAHHEPIIIHDDAISHLVDTGKIHMNDGSMQRYALGLHAIL